MTTSSADIRSNQVYEFYVDKTQLEVSYVDKHYVYGTDRFNRRQAVMIETLLNNGVWTLVYDPHTGYDAAAA